MKDTSTQGIHVDSLSSLTQETESGATIEGKRPAPREEVAFEAAIILIAHPEHRRLGTRFRLTPGTTLEIGRSPATQISLPEVPSLSRTHARIRYLGSEVTIEDLGSRNGTYVNDRSVRRPVGLASGDRFQVGAVHFKFLHEKDVEHAYYEAIYEMVVRDGLTGVFNRRKFLEEANREVVRAQRHDRSLALTLIDIDEFKQVNDSYGHLAGDAVLKQLASRIGSRVRQEDVFARLGGEEFAILSPETDAVGAARHAEALRRICEAEPFDCTAARIDLTCSFGVAGLAAEHRGIEDLLRSADGALYRAKREGRNGVWVIVSGRAQPVTGSE